MGTGEVWCKCWDSGRRKYLIFISEGVREDVVEEEVFKLVLENWVEF